MPNPSRSACGVHRATEEVKTDDRIINARHLRPHRLDAINHHSATSPWDSRDAVRSRLQRSAEIYLPSDVYSEIQHFDIWSPDVDAPEGSDGSPMISGVAALYGLRFLEWRSRYPELFPAYAADDLNFSAYEKAWNLLEGMPGRWLRVDLCSPGGFCHPRSRNRAQRNRCRRRAGRGGGGGHRGTRVGGYRFDARTRTVRAAVH